ncbi:MAG: response regulator, partial [Candidatus Marinimicrobia bacterium]|nr:response regulator [Candidatus Neomarinimicrobiota bacterium]
MKYEKYDIVIVEDNENDAELIVRTLKKIQVTNNMIVLVDGEQALDFLFCKRQYSSREKSSVPKVIFLDIKLPKVNGLDVLKQLRSNEHTKGIPIVMLTSSKQGSDVKAAYDLGANSYVVKPIDYKKFK